MSGVSLAGHRQAIFAADGAKVYEGAWNPKTLLTFVRSDDMHGARVLDIGANTGGFSLEIARLGAKVVAAEPNPYGQMDEGLGITKRLADSEGLQLEVAGADLFSSHTLGSFDVIICFGLLYHFRDPQYVIDYLASCRPRKLYISCQTYPGDELVLVNRASPGVLAKGHLQGLELTGWHPTRPLLEAMIRWGGFANVESMTGLPFNFPQKPAGATNSAYYRAELNKPVDPEAERKRFYPR